MASDGINLEVWYLCDQGVNRRRDAEFGKSFAWDLPMLEGYAHRFLDLPGWNLRKPLTMRLRQSLRPLFEQTNATHLWVEGWRFPAFWQAVFQAKRAGLKVWCRGESNDLAPEPRAPKRWIKRVLLGWFFGQIDAFLCIGSANRRLYLNSGVLQARLNSAPYCVDNERFRAQAEEKRPQRTVIRKTWNIPEDAICVLFAGKLIPKKRPLDLVAALELLLVKDERQKFHLLVVGSGELEQAIRARCTVAYGSPVGQPPPRSDAVAVSFTGFLNQSEICGAYVAADCLVLPSDTGETWGLVVNEAMAAATPCVVSDLCGCAEDLVVPIDPMLRYGCGNILELANALRRVANDRPSAELVERVIDTHNIRHTVNTVKTLLTNSQEMRAR